VASVAPAMTAETVVNISVSGLPVSPPDVAFRIPAPPSDSVEIDEAACILSQFADLVSEEKAIPAVTDSQGFSKVVSNRSDSPPSYSDGLSAIPPGYFDVKLESEPALKRVRSGGASSTVSEPTPVLDHHTRCRFCYTGSLKPTVEWTWPSWPQTWHGCVVALRRSLAHELVPARHQMH
jgi:hypothetical protein